MRKIRSDLHPVNPAFLNGVEHAFLLCLIGDLAFYRMLIATTGIIEIGTAILILDQVSVDYRISRIKQRSIGQFLKWSGRLIRHSYADTEIFLLVGRILPPIRTEEHIELPVTLVHFRRPEISDCPRIGRIAPINLPFRLPMDQIIGRIGAKTVYSPGTGTIHIITSVRGQQYVWIAKLDRQRITVR